jgi:hypothetical protein
LTFPPRNEKCLGIIVALLRLLLFSEVTHATPHKKRADGIEKTYFYSSQPFQQQKPAMDLSKIDVYYSA